MAIRKESVMQYLFIFLLALALSACGSGSNATPTTLEMTVESPTDLAELSNTLYQVVLETSNGETTLLAATVPTYSPEDGLYRLEVSDIIDAEEVAVVFRYISETESTEEAPLILAESVTEMSWQNGETLTLSLAADSFDTDIDTDGDGLANLSELLGDTDPLEADTDGDGVDDSLDAFPALGSESADFDGDGVGDGSDTDIDNDGLENDAETALGTNPQAGDSDDDDVGDAEDNCPLVLNSDQVDTDGDASGDVCDLDDDNDGLTDSDEAARGSSSLLADTDGDGTGDAADRFPTDGSETVDTDGDGVGDAADTDDDGDQLSDVAEVSIGTNPLIPDSDTDGILDGADNCPLFANTAQTNTDGDSQGDVCDPDDDNDTLADSEETNYGADGWLSESRIADSDGDGKTDSTDNCPLLANTEQIDTDGDGDGDACDCQSLVTATLSDPEAYHHRALDLPDLHLEDRNCDGVDGTHEADTLPIYLSATATATGDGSLAAPYTDLATALAAATAADRDLYIAEGEYDVGDVSVSLARAPRIYGGFDASFASRSLDHVTTPTVIYAESGDTVLAFEDLDGGVLQGLDIDARHDATDDLTLLEIASASDWQLEGNRLSVSSGTVSRVTALSIDTSENILVSGSNLAASNASDEHVGMRISDSSVTLRNTMIETGESKGTVGLAITNGSTVEAVHLTIDGGRHPSGSASGIELSGSSLSLANSIILVEQSSASASGMVCSGSDTVTLTVSNTLFYLGITDEIMPLYLDNCEGNPYVSAEALEASTAVTASGITLLTENRAALVDEANHLVDDSPAIDGGHESTLAAETSGIVLDLDGEVRSDGLPDLGADEWIE